MRYLHQISSNKGFVDLHNHTNSSFGDEMGKTGITPVGLLEEATEYANKYDAPVTFSVSDHNNTQGNVEVMERIKSNPEKYKNINFIPGCEYTVSTASVGYIYDDQGHRRPVLDGKVHMLAYNFDVNNPTIKYVDMLYNTENQYMKRIKNTPVRNGSLVFATQKWLESKGLKAGIEEFSKNCPIIPDFEGTKGGIEKFIKGKFGLNANDIQSWQSFVSDGQNLVRYAKADVQEIMSIVQKAGGYTVLAHPGLYRPAKAMYNLNTNDPRNAKFRDMDWTEGENLTGEAKIRNQKKMMNWYDFVFKALTEDAYNPITGEKLDGIVGYELLHSANQGNPNKFEDMVQAGERYGLYVTAGSDSHGDLHPNAIFSRVIHSKVDGSAIKNKDKSVSHFAVIGCKFIDDLKKSEQKGKKLTRDKSMNVDNQFEILKVDGDDEKVINLGDFRKILSANANGHSDSKGGKKHGHRHLEEQTITF